MKMQAIWKDQILAESAETVVVEGNHYFPVESLTSGVFAPSETHTTCAWKGEASYYNLQVGEATNTDAAWYYPNPKPEAALIKGRVAFWRGVRVVETH